MDKVFNEFNENRARLGAGSGLYTDYFQNDGKYALLAPLIDTPFISSDIGEVEIKVASAASITKIEGVETLNAAEAGIYMHRDVIELLEKVNGKTLNLISMAGDGSGYKYTGTISYTPTNAEMDTAWQGTIKITPVTKPQFDSKIIRLIKPSNPFASSIPAMVTLESTTGTYVIDNIETKIAESTIKAKSDDEATATAAISDKKLTITGVKAGYAVIYLTTKKEGYAEWTTSVLVNVPSNGA